MHVVVLVKQVLDPELPARAFRVNAERIAPDVARAPRVLSIFDGNALEVALKLRESSGDVRITALSVGDKGTEDALRKALAVTADAAILVSDNTFLGVDGPALATILASAIRSLGDVDVVLAGRQAADWETGQIGSVVAEELGWPCVTFVSRVSRVDGRLRLRRELEDGYQVIEASGPLVATVTNDESNVLRFAKVRDVMVATRKPIPVWDAARLGLDPGPLGSPSVEVLDLAVPDPPTRAEMIEGDSPAEKARNLARRLRELNVL